MALSNWDTLAFDENGEPSDGNLYGPDGTSVQFYKNWLYVGDLKAWVAERQWIEPTIAQINSGHLFIANFEITAFRYEEQNAIFALVESYKDGKVMAGISCYGYDGDTW